MTVSESSVRVGFIYGLIAYGLWGIVPIYFKALQAISPDEILAHRVVWSAIMLFILLAALGRLPDLWKSFGSRAIVRRLAFSSLLIGINWYAFIYCVVTGQMIQGSLGYFILPLVNVAIGTIFFAERMRWIQYLALALATTGVLNLIFQLGIVPWIAITVAISFALYGVVRKQTPVQGTTALTIETLLLSPIALVYLVYLASHDRLAFGSVSARIDVLLVLGGVVTSVPLLCYAEAVHRLRLITIGFLQYLSPSLAFLLAVGKYDEDFSVAHQVSFGLIWAGLAIFIVDALRQIRSHQPDA